MIKSVIKMKKFIAVVLTLLLILNLPACSDNTDETESNDLTFYCVKDTYDDLAYIIKRYNKECTGNSTTENKIEIVEFDSEQQMYEKMSTEIMAGGGPDILSLYQTLPFEKLIENNAFADINEIAENDTSKDKINFDEYNSVIMNAGVFNKNRYIVPAFYRPDIMLSGEKTLKKFNITTEQGTTLTYSNINEVFKDYFENPDGYSFIYDDDFLWFRYPYEFLFDYIISCVDFEKKQTSFDTDEFKTNIDSLEKIIENSNNKHYIYDETDSECKVIFDDFSDELQVTEAQEFGRGIFESNPKPVIFNGLVNSSETYSANIEVGVAINANSENKEKAYMFIKYLLSEDSQEYYCGDKTGSIYRGTSSITLPVRNEAYEHHLNLALEITDDDGLIIGKDKDFNEFAKAYIQIIDNINQVSLYSHSQLSYYSKNVIGDIVNSYLDGRINKGKLILQLTNATEMYLNE